MTYSDLRPKRPSAAARGYTGRAWRGKDGYGGLRGEAYRRDKGICQQCGRMTIPKDAGNQERRDLWPHIDHIIPKDQGGQDTLENLQTLCGSCHSSKTGTE